MHRLSRRLLGVLAIAVLAVPGVATEAAAATPSGTGPDAVAQGATHGNGRGGGVVPMTAPCSGVGTAIPYTSPTEYWNGCVDASGGLNYRTHYGTGSVSYSDPVKGSYPFGTKVHIYCYLYGPSVVGYDGLATSIWDAVDWFQEPNDVVAENIPVANQFIVSTDAWIYTGSDGAVVPHC